MTPTTIDRAKKNRHPEHSRAPSERPLLVWVESEGRAANFAGNPTAEERLLTASHALYKAGVAPILHSTGFVPGGCRFQPTCSEYATLALSQHGLARGLWLTLARLLRCHPFAGGGWDPVPPAHHGSSFMRPEPAPAGTIEEPHSTHDSA